MSLKEKIQQDLKTAVKERGEFQSSVLRLLLAALLSKEKEKRYRLSKEKEDLKEEELVKESQLTDEEVIEVISSEIKKKKEAITMYEKEEEKNLPSHLLEKMQGRVEKEKKAIEAWQKYLPKQLSEEEIKKIAREAIIKVEAADPKDMGKVMQELVPQVKGKADGGQVSKIVKELLEAR